MTDLRSIDADIERLRAAPVAPPKPAALQLAEQKLRAARTDLMQLTEAEREAHQRDRHANRNAPSDEAQKAAKAVARQQGAVDAAEADVNKQREAFGEEFLKHLVASKSERQRVLTELLDLLELANERQREAAAYAAANKLPADHLTNAAPHLAAFVREARRIIAGNW